MARTIILYSKAFTLLTKNGKELNDEQKIEAWRGMSRESMFRVTDYFNFLEFGLNDERELKCNLCGTVTRGNLRQEFDIVELLPLQSGASDTSRKRPRLDIFVGV